MAFPTVEVESSSGNITDGISSITSGTFTPPNNSLLVACFTCQRGATSIAPTMSGGSLEWTKQAEGHWNADFGAYASVWTAPVLTGASMSVTADSGSAGYNRALTIYAVTNYGNIGGKAEDAAASRPAGGSYSKALSPTPASTSVVIGCSTSDEDIVTGSTPGSGWTADHNVEYEGYMVHIHQRKNGVTAYELASLDCDFAYAIAAIEIKESNKKRSFSIIHC